MWVFGWRTATLALVSLQCLCFAAALSQSARNRAANRLLAALLVVFVGVLTPFTLGFAGAYDAWPWLSFAPFAVPLAIGPLAYGYAYALAWGAPPRRLGRHLAPAVLQFGYLAICFALPVGWKTAWNMRVHEPWIDPGLQAVALVSVAAYALAALRLLRRYRGHLAQAVSDPPRYAAGWLAGVLGAVVALLGAWSVYRGWEWAFGRLSYVDTFGLYLVLAAVALYLAVEGWRHAGLAFPSMADIVAAPVAEAKLAAARDWRGEGERWAARVEGQGWWRDPELTLASLAARLGTNTSHLSRALNEGLGVNFASFVNGLRARAVAQALRTGRREDLLTLALEAGFASKASFNRTFAAEFGVSPSAYRRAHVSKAESSSPDQNLRRTHG